MKLKSQSRIPDIQSNFQSQDPDSKNEFLNAVPTLGIYGILRILGFSADPWVGISSDRG